MLGFITDDKNDLMLDRLGNIRLEDGIEAQRQNLINALRLQQYEYGYDLTQGLNYMGYILGEGANVSAWESQVFELLGSLDYVKNIVSWAYNVSGDRFLFNLVVDTDLGRIEIEG